MLDSNGFCGHRLATALLASTGDGFHVSWWRQLSWHINGDGFVVHQLAMALLALSGNGFHGVLMVTAL